MATRKSEQSFGRLPTQLKIALLLLLLVIVTVAYYFALHFPLQQRISAAQRQYVTLNNEVGEARERNTEYLRLRETLAAREGLDRANLRALPEEGEMAAFLGDLNQKAELSGLTIRLVEPRPDEPDEHYVRLPVTLQLTGRYHQLARFFYHVSRLDRLISMENIHLSEPERDGEEVMLTVDVLATTYRRPGDVDANAEEG